MSNRKADNLLLFKAIVDCGSLSTAARSSNISVSQASKRMSHLEHTLGIQLLHRSTRKLSLTHPGEILYKKLGNIKSQIESAWQSMLDYTDKPKGEIRFSSCSYYAAQKLIPFTQSFNEQHPQIQINLELINQDEILESSKYDLQFISHAMGPGELLPDSHFCAKKVHDEALVFVASKNYLEKNGTPTHPEELNKHQCLAINNSDKGMQQWTFYNGETPFKQPIDVAFAINTYEALHQAAKTGMGIALIPEGLLDENDDSLQVVLQDFSKDRLETYAYYTKNKNTSKKLSLVLDGLSDTTPP